MRTSPPSAPRAGARLTDLHESSVRHEAVWLPLSALLVIASGILILRGERTFASLLTLLATFSVLMTFLTLRRARRRSARASGHEHEP